jgi:Ca2+-binding RTX toxin-like protein
VPVTQDQILYALLSLDSYHRGYNRGIELEAGSKFFNNLEFFEQRSTEEISFYASAYKYTSGDNEGKIIISYRGTDDMLIDPFTGWTIGAGITIGNQAPVAIDFFEKIVNDLLNDPEHPYKVGVAPTQAQQDVLNKIVVTGHSLGGGLAGYVGSLAHVKTEIFDHMPFGIASALTYIFNVAEKIGQSAAACAVLGIVASTDPSGVLLQIALSNPELVQQALSAASIPSLPDWVENVHGYHVDGEMLEYLRDGSGLSLAAALLARVPLLNSLTSIAVVYALGISSTDALVPQDELSVYGWQELNPGLRHSQALQVALLYSEKNGHADWHTDDDAGHAASNAILSGLFDDEVASALGFEKGSFEDETVLPSDQMFRKMAYSVIESGETVFGNTSFKALFNDANQLGLALHKNQTLFEGADALGQIIAQYSGLLAEKKVLEADNAEAVDGILEYDAGNALLTVDLTDEKWSGDGAFAAPGNIVGRTSFAAAYFSKAGAASQSVSDSAAWLWGLSLDDAVKKFILHLTNDDINLTLEDPTSGTPAAWVALDLFGDGNDNIVGSAAHDFIIGGDGDDTLSGAGGSDLLAGGDGDDTFLVGEGRDVFAGGRGDDMVDYGAEAGWNVTATQSMIQIESQNSEKMDRLYGIETVKLSAGDDYVRVTGFGELGTSTEFEGRGQTSEQGDTVDFSWLASGIYISSGGEALSTGGFGGSIKYSNMETVWGTSQTDIYNDSTTKNTNVFLGDGNDIVLNSGAGVTIDLGSGNDIVVWNPASAILNFGASDLLSLGSLALFGGIRYMYGESPYATHFGGLVKYGISSAGDLIIKVAGIETSAPNVPDDMAGSMFIRGWGGSYGSFGTYTGNGQITLAEYAMTAIRLMKIEPGMGTIHAAFNLMIVVAKTAFGANWGKDPLVLDLDGDGYDLTMLSVASPQFDGDEDLYKERSGWVGRDDGLLVRDIGNDGVISDASELFGGRTSGFDILSTLDGNADGIINVDDDGLVDFDGDGVVDADDAFADLKVWRDLNQNGTSEADELASVTTYGIQSFSTSKTTANLNVAGNTIVATGTFQRSNGTNGNIGEAILRQDNLDTTYNGPEIAISAEALALPNLKGYGTLVSLREAISVDPAGVALVEQTLDTLDLADRDLAALRETIRPLLLAWRNGSPVRDETGAIVSGSTVSGDYSDLSVITDGTTVTDYNWSRANESFTVDGQSEAVTTYQYTSGLSFSLTQPLEPGAVHAIWGAPVSSDSIEIVRNGVTATVIDHVFSNGEHLYVHTTSGGYPTLQVLLNGSYDTAAPEHHYRGTTIAAADLEFFSRFMGVDLPLDQEALSTSQALSFVQTFLETMETALNLFAVRVAVQSDAFSAVFEGIAYDEEANAFVSTTDEQLVPTLENLFALANAQSSPINWLDSWEPMFEIVFSDFKRDEGRLNTNGWVGQNIIAAYERVAPTFDLKAAVAALGFDETIYVVGAGERIGTAEADIFYLDSSTQTAKGGLGIDNYIAGARFGQDVIDDVEGALNPQSRDVLRFTAHNKNDLQFTREDTDLVITDTLTGDTIRILGQFSGEWAGPMGSGYWPDKGVAEISFADGTAWDEIDIAKAASHADAASTTVTGTADNNYLDGGAGNDRLEGQGDGDVYLFGPGYGHDTINDLEDNPFRSGFDVLTFKTGISVEDLSFSRDGDSDDVVITIGDDQLTIEDQFAATYTGVFSTVYSNQIELFAFQDGGILSADDFMDLVLDDLQTTGDDSVYGFSREDVIEGGTGNDFMSGGNEDDVYLFSRGDGNDTISEAMDNLLGGQDDAIHFSPDIAAENVTFTRDGSDLVATVDSGGGSIRIRDQYDFLETGVFGAVNFNLVEEFAFSGGIVLNWRDVMRTVISQAQTSGDDHVLGSHFDDEFDGGAGDDTLEGDAGSDTYYFGNGYGNDTVSDYLSNTLAGNDDVIAFKAGMTQSNIQMSRTGTDLDDLVITLAGGDSLTVKGQFDYLTINVRLFEIEHFTFDDGSSLTSGGLRLLYIAQHQTAGNDTIDGFYTYDTIEGGAGNDLQRGGDGSDTYVFNTGFGQDTVAETVHYTTYNDADVLKFGAGILAADAVLSRNGNDLTIGFANTSDRVTVTGQFSHVSWFDGWQDIETVAFDDGTTWDMAYVRSRLITEAATSGNDTVTGFYGADTLDGGAGNDLLKGLGGGDTYLFGRGSGQDRVIESIQTVYEDQADKIAFKADVLVGDILFVKVGNDLLISINGAPDTLTLKDHFASSNSRVESFVFADGTVMTWEEVADLAVANQATPGNDTITGTTASDLLDGDTGNDLLKGGDGADVYHFSAGFGQDTIEETVGHVAISDDDAIVFAEGINASDAVLSRSGDDLTISFAGTTDSVTIKDQFAHAVWYPSWTDIEHVYFADGTAWTDASIRVSLIAQQQTAGNDSVRGYFTADIFNAGSGNDTIYGYGGGDTYHFKRGDGADTIYENVQTVYEDQADKIVFASDISALDVNFTKVGNDLRVNILGTTDQITVKDYFVISYYQVENFVFASGLTYGVTEVTALANRAQPTSGADMLIGTIAIDRMEGGLGNDTLKGLSQSDVYVYNLGDGADTIYEDDYATDTDALSLGAGITTSNLLIARSGFTGAVLTVSGQSGSITLDSQFKAGGWGGEQIEFASGTVWALADIRAAYLSQAQTSGNDTIWGFDGINDSLAGGNGNDIIRGGTGSDTYSYAVGNGNDTLYEGANAGETDRLVLGSGLNSSGLTYTRSGNSLTLNFTAQSAAITLDSQLLVATAGYGFEQIEFGNGTVWSAADLLYNYAMSLGTSSNQTINGVSNQADFIGGGLGNDTLQGNTGNDWYYYNLGDGADQINESASSTDVDRLILGAGLTTSNIVISRSGFQTATLSFTGQAGSIYLDSQFYDVSGYGVEQIQFNDGTLWSVADIRAAYLASVQTSGNDTVRGFNSINDTLQGGLGNDTLYGYSGADTYVYNVGDGVDTVYEASSNEIDKLALGAGITTSNILLSRSALTGLTVSVAGQSGSIYFDTQFFASGSQGIEQIAFNDSTVWELSDIRTAYLNRAQTSGNDTIYGFDGRADFLTGGLGNDSIYGGSGNDTYNYNLGDGADLITETSSSVDTDVLAFGAGISSSNLLLSRSGRVGVVLTVQAQSGSVNLQSQFDVSGQGIEQFQFSNGTTWNLADMRAAYLTQTQTSGNDVVYAFDGINDSLAAGLGNDSLYGYGGNDTYTYNLGDGNDRIYESSGTSFTDTLVLGSGITTSNLLVTRTTSDHLTLTFNGQSGSIILDTQLFGSGWGVEQVQFADSTTWAAAQLASAAWFRGTTGNDTITATSGADKIDGGSGNDTLNGGSGSGNDVLLGNAGNDSLTGGAGADDFMFSATALNGTDTIVDFSHGLDRLVFTGSDYGFTAGQPLSTAQFTTGTTAVGSSAQFIWDNTTKHLYWDADGTGAAAAVDLAVLTGATVTKEDLYFV